MVLWWVGEVADVLGFVVNWAVCSPAAFFADTSHPGSVAIGELSDMWNNQMDELVGKILKSRHDVQTLETEMRRIC